MLAVLEMVIAAKRQVRLRRLGHLVSVVDDVPIGGRHSQAPATRIPNPLYIHKILIAPIGVPDEGVSQNHPDQAADGRALQARL